MKFSLSEKVTLQLSAHIIFASQVSDTLTLINPLVKMSERIGGLPCEDEHIYVQWNHFLAHRS